MRLRPHIIRPRLFNGVIGRNLDYYVDPIIGSNSFDGRDPLRPWRDWTNLYGRPILHGIGVACSGQDITVDSYTPTTSGVSSKPIAVKSYATPWGGSSPSVLTNNSVFHGAWTSQANGEYSIPCGLALASVGDAIFRDPNSGAFTVGTLSALTRGSAAGSLTAGQYTISGGKLYVKIASGAPAATDYFYVGTTRNNLFNINVSYWDFIGIKARLGGADLFGVANNGDATGVRFFGVDLSVTNGGMIHCATTSSAGTARGVKVDGSYLHDGLNGQNAFAGHADGGSSVGGDAVIRNTTIENVEGWGQTSFETWTITTDMVTFKNAKVLVLNGGPGTPGALTFNGVTWAGDIPGMAVSDYYINLHQDCRNATAVSLSHCSLIKPVAGSFGTSGPRGLLHGGDLGSGNTGVTLTMRNNLAVGSFGIALQGGSNPSVRDEDHTGYYLTGDNPTFQWTLGAHDVSLGATPFVDMANYNFALANTTAGNLAKNAGDDGRDLGVSGAVAVTS